jgi:hypothetical protein
VYRNGTLRLEAGDQVHGAAGYVAIGGSSVAGQTIDDLSITVT